MATVSEELLRHLREVEEQGYGTAALTHDEAVIVLKALTRLPEIERTLLQAALIVDTLAKSASEILPYETVHMLKKEAAEWTLLLHNGNPL